MTVGTTWLLRNATVTNVVGHSYQLLTAPTPDEEAYGDTRFFTSFDLSGWDEVSDATFNGPTADGSIIRTDTVVLDGEYIPQA
jgi:hypothetical protein